LSREVGSLGGVTSRNGIPENRPLRDDCSRNLKMYSGVKSENHRKKTIRTTPQVDYGWSSYGESTDKILNESRLIRVSHLRGVVDIMLSIVGKEFLITLLPTNYYLVLFASLLKDDFGLDLVQRRKCLEKWINNSPTRYCRLTYPGYTLHHKSSRIKVRRS
jgi:hypothetical protein